MWRSQEMRFKKEDGNLACESPSKTFSRENFKSKGRDMYTENPEGGCVRDCLPRVTMAGVPSRLKPQLG